MSAGHSFNAPATARDAVSDPARADVLRGLFPPAVEIALSNPRAPQPALWPDEASAIARAVPARAQEFAAGRAAARAALGALGHPPAAIPMAPDRAPVWPADVVGSISHTADLCAAALAPAAAFRAIGIDLEDHADLPADLLPMVCTLDERAWLASQPRDAAGILARLIFSAKECAYKCQYRMTETLFDFDTLEVTPDLDTGQFEATFTRQIGAFGAGARLAGRFVITQDLIACGMALGSTPGAARG
ncbi:4'-phosphopantetheinyl transferase superfamily protein [Pseudosulfitobacter sp. DSM 107133]|uniref:4'-phosphopantetheinyl transferase family protein n=1 Tax=Pseudosulfitobacter sp. DSM 107133 TaxID=2883100 RepID=UPI000DF14EA3|nr:4'-phosphopantetheinyl transferase superfamily protein [Pseudosulfitobacter sp. DSM 107133]UOA26823.1 4'-phosphopantetheinyl transferase Npt [Pseudosulfitobacter sp. DSM 107133]